MALTAGIESADRGAHASWGEGVLRPFSHPSCARTCERGAACGLEGTFRANLQHMPAYAYNPDRASSIGRSN